jgi:sulfur-carrier protein
MTDAPARPSYPQPTGLRVTVRYFAAARAAAGTETETLTVEPDTTIAELADNLSRRDSKLAAVLSRCSYLCDGVAVRDRDMPLRSRHTVDVLPPFAGG